jgi:hypothetical protein
MRILRSAWISEGPRPTGWCSHGVRTGPASDFRLEASLKWTSERQPCPGKAADWGGGPNAGLSVTGSILGAPTLNTLEIVRSNPSQCGRWSLRKIRPCPIRHRTGMRKMHVTESYWLGGRSKSFWPPTERAAAPAPHTVETGAFCIPFVSPGVDQRSTRWHTFLLLRSRTERPIHALDASPPRIATSLS